MSTWFNTKLGASGSALGAGLPPPAAPQPDEVQVSQLANWAAPEPLTPDPVPALMFI
jgi:hypothetical protein